MRETVIALLVCVALIAASLGSRALYDRIPERHRPSQAEDVVRLIASIFVVLASLVLGLMISSAKTTFESIDRAVHTYATQLILLDRTMRQYGPETEGTRQYLLNYVQQAARRMAQSDPVLGSRPAEALLKDVASGLRALTPTDAERAALKLRAEQRFETIYEMRWALVEQSDGTIPVPLIVLLAAWLILVFASYGYRAPHNAFVMTSFVVSSILIGGTIYLMLDMDFPFNGTIQVSSGPLERAVAEMQK